MEIRHIYQLANQTIKELAKPEPIFSNREWGLLNVYDIEKATFHGFGGALTQSSAHNFFLLNNEEQEKALELLVGESGLGYSRFRLCVGSSDFATHSYCYVSENDATLSSFSIEEDKMELIPFIKRVMNHAHRKPSFYASSWSCPAFMKDNNDRLHGGKLKKECYDLYAEYLVKYLLAYKHEGIDVDALTIQNEPKATQTWESCVFDAKEEAEFGVVLKKHLHKHGLDDVKLYCWDHNKERLVERAVESFKTAPGVFSGAAYHWYSGDHFDAISALRTVCPNMEIFASEFCQSRGYDVTSSSYANEIINDLRQGSNAIVEWNVMLDENGGPYHDRGKYKNAGCDAPIIVDSKCKTSYPGPTYWQTYMFSHFVEPDAKILFTSSFDEAIKVNAIKNPNGDIVVQVLNQKEEKDICLYIAGMHIPFPMPKDSLTTFVIKI